MEPRKRGPGGSNSVNSRPMRTVVADASHWGYLDFAIEFYKPKMMIFDC